MNRIHALAASLIVGIGAIFGVAATTKTAGIGAGPQAAQAPDSAIAARTRKLNRAEAALRKARANRPPALPTARTTAPQPQVQQVSAPVSRSTSSGDDSEGGDD